MLSIAKTLEKQGDAIEVLMKRTVEPVRHLPVKSGHIEQKIEHDTADSQFMMQVVFAGDQSRPYDERKRQTEQFLREMEGLLGTYKVKSLKGSYVRSPL